MTSGENDPRAPFEQLADDLRRQIRTGAIEPGQKLPSVRKLAEQSGFVSATVQKSLHVLRTEGLIFTTGRGSFAHDPAAPYEEPVPAVTGAEFAALKAQLAELSERVQTIETKLADRRDA